MVRSTLPNGLQVLVLRLPHVHSVSHSLLVRGGPRFELEPVAGISHMVEHLLFRGTKAHPDSLSFNIAVEALGGEINGLTQRDAVTIHMTLPPETALLGLQLLGDVVTEPLLTGLSIERNVVMEEILDTLDQDGNELDADTLARRALWPEHPISLPIAGTPETIEALTEEACRRHFEQLFVAENAVLCVAGPVDPPSVFDIAARAFGRMPRGTALVPDRAPEPALSPAIQVQPTDDSQVSLLFTFPAPHENDPDFATLLLLRRLLDDGFGARLRQALCEQTGLAYSLGACVDAYADAAALDVELSCAPKKVLRAANKVLETLAGLARTPVTPDELDRAKRRHRAEIAFALDDPGEMCGWYGAMVLVGSDVDYEARLNQVLAVTEEQVRALAERIFTLDRCLLTLIGPVEEEDVLVLERELKRPPGSSEWGFVEESSLGEDSPDIGDDSPEVGDDSLDDGDDSLEDDEDTVPDASGDGGATSESGPCNDDAQNPEDAREKEWPDLAWVASGA